MLPHPASVWNTTANPPPALTPLAGDITTDVAILGAGFTGLTAALELARRNVACVMLEANAAGWGGSGRNGGMAVLRYKTPWATLASRYGDAATRELHAQLHHALDAIEARVGRHRIECGFDRSGHITAAWGKKALAMLERDCAWLAANGDRVPRLLTADEARELTGTPLYLGGYLDRRGAGIHPLNYATGLAQAAHDAGVMIFVGTPATRVHEEPDAVRIETPGGVVRARQVLVATNAYTELHAPAGNLQQRVVPVSTSVITTEPLPPELMQRLLPQGHLVSDTRHLLNYFRVAPGNRMLFGGRGSLTGKESLAVYAGLERKLVETFPLLADVPIDHRWSGKVAVTLDDFPHVGRLSPRVAYAMGYGGRGVVLTSLLGELLARLACGEKIAAGPMTDAAFAPVPFHALRIPGMKMVAGWYGLLDRLRV